MRSQHTRLTAITYRLPAATGLAQQAFSALAGLLHGTPGSCVVAHGLVITPTYPTGSLPRTALIAGDTGWPEVVLDTSAQIDIRVNLVRMHSTVTASTGTDAVRPLAAAIRAGEPVSLQAYNLLQHFRGHVLRLDHTGVELPAAMVDALAWQRLQQTLGAVTNLYAYPSGEQWPFIVPATEEEFTGEMTQFAGVRSPKFELTYGYVDVPTIHFHMDTDLPRAVVEERLPSPYGFALGNSQTVRSVYLQHPWPAFAIRCDLTFARPLTNWETGEWLVKQGWRIAPPQER